MKKSKIILIYIVTLFMCNFIFCVFMLGLSCLIPKLMGENLSISVESPRVVVVKADKGVNKKVEFLFKNGNLKTLKFNKKIYTKTKYIKSKSGDEYSFIKNILNMMESCMRILVVLLIAVAAWSIVFFSPEEVKNGDMLYTNMIPTVFTTIITVITFVVPGIKNDYIISLIVVFYTIIQAEIKYKSIKKDNTNKYKNSFIKEQKSNEL